MESIFVSHCVADTELAELLLNHLTDAVGVSPADIFCSSVPGHGVPLTFDFNERMRERIGSAKLVILLMTPSYLDSAFCLMELGATWSRSVTSLPIVVSPVTFDDVSRTVGLKQGWNIEDNRKLLEVRKTVLGALGIPGHGLEHYDRRRRQLETLLPGVLSRLAPSPKVLRSGYDEAVEMISDLKDDVARLEEGLRSLEHRLASVREHQPVAIILEPEEMIAQDLQLILEEIGFTVGGHASNERDAIDLALRVKPAIVLSEIVLERGDSGLSAVQKIVEHTGASPVFVTAWPEKLLRSDRPEPMHLVTKPFDKTSLQMTIREAYGRFTPPSA